MDATATFEEHRRLLFGVAYRMLGTVMDAEDVVQDAWLRWRTVGHEEVDNPESFLVRVVTRLSIDRLRQLGRRKETYVGEWLPEPVLTAHDAMSGGPRRPDPRLPDVAEEVIRADSVSFGLMVVLESLSPLERAVFVLREAFDYSYDEIAELLERTPAAVRQLGKRARDHVQERRHRFDVDAKTQRAVTVRFLTAAATGAVEDLLELLAPDVELHSDGGGLRKAPLRIIEGADKVGRFLAAIAQQPPPAPTAYLAPVNDGTALVVLSEGRVDSVFWLEVEAPEGAAPRIRAMHLLANPEKLGALADVPRVGTPFPLGPPPG